ncbi:hypothetical protein FN846DRAFT_893409 [Sphaerosporella brunnea]|uniref:Uncharacterized protein n=1 Tax=Sphaerosporella brunnea TaxID=1250544 RepID=A0A5J5ELG2_9PEZI|nr:hypothetical protein FN846DRAFT_893409 [Sphaerosporella brunnea]
MQNNDNNNSSKNTAPTPPVHEPALSVHHQPAPPPNLPPVHQPVAPPNLPQLQPPAQQLPAPIDIRVMLFRRAANGLITYGGDFRFRVRAGLTWMDLATPCAHLYGIQPHQLMGVVWNFDHQLPHGCHAPWTLLWQVANGGDNSRKLEELLWRFATFGAGLQTVDITM